MSTGDNPINALMQSFPKSAVPGTYTITFTGTSGSTMATATADFIVQ
jgi:hypothetical protein